MAKRDVIHKTGSTQRSATPPEEDRATATEDPHTNVCDDRSSGSRDMIADRHTGRQTDGLITILRNRSGVTIYYYYTTITTTTTNAAAVVATTSRKT